MRVHELEELRAASRKGEDFRAPPRTLDRGASRVSDSSGEQVTSEPMDRVARWEPGSANPQMAQHQLSAKAGRFVIVSLQTAGIYV